MPQPSLSDLLSAATDADAIAPPRMELIALPDRKTLAGEPVKVLVRGASNALIVSLSGGFPIAADPAAAPGPLPTDPAALAAVVQQYDQFSRGIARACVLKPRLSFDGPADGTLDWDSLSFADQTAVVDGISRCTGGKVTAESRSFRDDDGGGGGGGAGADAAVRDAEAAVGGDVPERAADAVGGP